MLNAANPSPIRLFLARHGESIANQQQLISGQLDTPLSEKGKQQAQWLRDVLKHNTLSAIFTSSLSRTVETAKPTADYHGLNIQSIDDLKEFHFGELQGVPVNVKGNHRDSHRQVRAADQGRMTISGAESYSAFERRITQCLDRLMSAVSGDILIVGHRNTNEVILAKLLSRTFDMHKTINVKNKYLYEIELGLKTTVNTIRLGGEHHGIKFPGLKDD